MVLASLQKPRPRVLTQQDRDREKARNWRDVSKSVRLRDQGKCRVCGKPGTDPHHIVYRSHGGRDVESNLVWSCRPCHKAIHAKVTLVTFNPKNPAGTIKFTRNTQWDCETRGA